MNLELKDIGNPTHTGYNYYLNIEGYGCCKIDKSPLHDCQTYTVGNMATILGKPNALEILKFIYSKIGKAQMLFNVQEGLISKLKLVIPADMIVVENVYTSTNNSIMCMFLVKTQFLK